LQEHRPAAIKAILVRLDGAGMPATDFARLAIQSGALRRGMAPGSDAALEIEAHGFNETSINAELFCQAGDAFGTFDALLHRSQDRRIRLLRKINSRRDFSNPLAKRSTAP
jgi:hypothetical protein